MHSTTRPDFVRHIAMLGIFALASGIASADAATYTFQNITNNNAGDAAIGEAQFLLDVTDAGGGLAQFVISNSGPDAVSIANIYVDGDALQSISSITNGPGVDFSIGGSPPVLPGGNAVSFGVDLRAKAASPAPSNGINPGESLTMLFAIAAGKDFSDVIGAINNDDLRVGVHAIAYGSGGSESFVTVPEPATVGLLAFGAISMLRRRFCR
jgi:hypothetical protein